MPYFRDAGETIDLRPSDSYTAVRYQPGPNVPAAVAALTAGDAFGSKRDVIELPNDGLLLVPTRDRGAAENEIMALDEGAAFGKPREVFEIDGSLLVPDRTVNADFEGKSEEEIEELVARAGGEIVKQPSEDFPFHVLGAQDGDPFRLADELAESHGIEAQPRFTKLLKRDRFEAPAVAGQKPALGADPLLPRQWGLQAIRASHAWQLTSGEPEAVVAVIDDGVDLVHPDLRANLVTGYDDVDQDEKPQPRPENSHGTACAGIIAAAGHNGIGVRGVAFDARVMPVRMGYVVGHYFQERPGANARCINQAVARGAWVLSNSYGSPLPDMTVRKAIRNAVENGRGGRGCVFVASSGNNNSSVKYPARYPDAVAVAATRKDDDRCTPNDWGANQGSCYGPEVSVAAPGIDVTTTDHSGSGGYSPWDGSPDPDYTFTFGGTSAACPFVAGVAALMLSANPGLTVAEVRQILEDTADKTGSAPYAASHNDFLGHGRVNALAAVRRALP